MICSYRNYGNVNKLIVTIASNLDLQKIYEKSAIQEP